VRTLTRDCGTEKNTDSGEPFHVTTTSAGSMPRCMPSNDRTALPAVGSSPSPSTDTAVTSGGTYDVKFTDGADCRSATRTRQ
jgi:hypothetical protein